MQQKEILALLSICKLNITRKNIELYSLHPTTPSNPPMVLSTTLTPVYSVALNLYAFKMGKATIIIGTDIVVKVALWKRPWKSSISYKISDLLLRVIEAAWPIIYVKMKIKREESSSNQCHNVPCAFIYTVTHSDLYTVSHEVPFKPYDRTLPPGNIWKLSVCVCTPFEIQKGHGKLHP